MALDKAEIARWRQMLLEASRISEALCNGPRDDKVSTVELDTHPRAEMPFPFLSLPAELRNQIYKLTTQHVIPLDPSCSLDGDIQKCHGRRQAQLQPRLDVRNLRTSCRQIYCEMEAFVTLIQRPRNPAFCHRLCMNEYLNMIPDPILKQTTLISIWHPHLHYDDGDGWGTLIPHRHYYSWPRFREMLEDYVKGVDVPMGMFDYVEGLIVPTGAHFNNSREIEG
ncbi:MAG: hypothetical protein M1834_004688 [Cirrosporium novae-zelandiae]|nr:MAG: hypothetical protein M1834_004688 [Cirrosporium novae-zelandiae]